MLKSDQPSVAYFCMEFGLHEELPIYAGGLGILAGDFLKAAADAHMPVIGIGILWRNGYTNQSINNDGWPIDSFPENTCTKLIDTGQRIKIKIGNNDVDLRIWLVNAYGNAPLYLLEATGENAWITQRLYGCQHANERIAQEMVLGIGGVRAIQKLGLMPNIYHFNEGHAVLAGVELIRQAIGKGYSFPDAWAKIRRHIVFTTHTPVLAGNETHPYYLLESMGATNGLTKEEMYALGGDPFNMTVAGLRLANIANGVAQLHGITARCMWHNVSQAAPLLAITNGVHQGTWQDNRICMARVGKGNLWEAHQVCKNELLNVIKQRTGVCIQPDRLLVGFARRAAAYKRSDLLLQDAEFIRPLLESGQLQLVFSGKAHPADNIGKSIVARLVQAAHTYPGVVFLENYDMKIGRLLTKGCDVWLNNPRRPMEASGTSGMKAAMNGVLNLSVLDGWWPEGCQHGINGWHIGEGKEGGDDQDKASLQKLLVDEVIPLYYNNRKRWERMMQASIDMSAHFSSQRMLQQYFSVLYAACSEDSRPTCGDFKQNLPVSCVSKEAS